MEKKYELTDETMEFYGKTMHRIRALRDFGDVKAGELGGWIEDEYNLSHYGDAWVSDSAQVSDFAQVFGSAHVSGSAQVEKMEDYITISPIGSRNDSVTFVKDKSGISVVCGCFSGTIDQFEEAVMKTHGDNEHGKAYRLAIELAKLRIK